MWADDLEIVESCGFDLSLSYFDSINSIGVFAATDTFAHMKGPNLQKRELASTEFEDLMAGCDCPTQRL